MRVFSMFLDEEVKKLAAGKKTKAPASFVLAMAAEELKRRREPRTPRTPRIQTHADDISFLERLYRLEDPR